MKEIIAINEITPSKSNIEPAAQAMVQQVKDGALSAAEFAVKIKFLQGVLDTALKAIREDLDGEIGTAKDFTCLSAKIEPAETGTKYDYAADPQWVELTAAAKPYIDAINAREELIKAATKLGKSILDETTGEILATPVKRESTSSFKITLSK